jgi:hypothetical protein
MRDMNLCLICSAFDVTNIQVHDWSDVNHTLLLVDVNGVELFFFFSDFVNKQLVLRECRKLCPETENGRYSKKRSKVGSICFIRRISSVRFKFCDITEVIQMTYVSPLGLVNQGFRLS